MKKILFALIITTGLSSILFAQEADNSNEEGITLKKLRFGVYFAPNVSWMKPTAAKSDDGAYAVESNGTRVGYTWGLLTDYFFAENYGIATGFQLNTTGGNIIAARLDENIAASAVYNSDFKYYLQFLEIPLQLKLRSDEFKSGGLKAFGQIGVTFGANIGKKVTYDVKYRDEASVEKEIKGEKEKLIGSLTIAPLMMQLNIGAGIEKKISHKLSAYAGLFFNNGFLPDFTNPGKYNLGYKGSFSDGNIRLNNFALRLGLYF